MASFRRFGVSFATIYLSLLIQNGSPCTVEPIVPYIGDNLQIKYKVVENNYPNGNISTLIEMNFTNGGGQLIGNGNWVIYFHHIRMVDRENIRPNGTLVGTSGLRIYHHNGVLFRIEPTAEFAGLNPGQTLKLHFVGSDWTI